MDLLAAYAASEEFLCYRSHRSLTFCGSPGRGQRHSTPAENVVGYRIAFVLQRGEDLLKGLGFSPEDLETKVLGQSEEHLDQAGVELPRGDVAPTVRPLLVTVPDFERYVRIDFFHPGFFFHKSMIHPNILQVNMSHTEKS